MAAPAKTREKITASTVSVLLMFVPFCREVMVWAEVSHLLRNGG